MLSGNAPGEAGAEVVKLLLLLLLFPIFKLAFASSLVAPSVVSLVRGRGEKMGIYMNCAVHQNLTRIIRLFTAVYTLSSGYRNK